jgi:hypothetical protein
MLDSLFGAEMPLAVKFFLAFVIVLGAIGVLAWVVRRFGSGRLGGAGSRGRQPRLSVTEYARVDPRRQLILVRRDNVEHLVMIGGPTDLVVEPNIVRAVAAPRDVSVARPPAVEPLPRAIPLPENGNGSGWPLAPESTVGLRASPRLEPLPDEAPLFRPLEPRPQRDTLAALADELTTRPTPPAPTAPPRKPIETRQETRQETRKPMPPPAFPAPAAAAATDTAGDQSLADMAHRLETALRKPETEAKPSGPAPAEPVRSTLPSPPPPRPSRPMEAKPEAKPAPRGDGKPNQSKTEKTALYDSLEQEMASLLGRPTKT